MTNKTVVCYKSTTGFTERYAKLIADSLDCRLLPLSALCREPAAFDLLIFGGRCCAGRIDGLKKAKALAARAGAGLVVFATGAMPEQAVQEIDRLWSTNLTPDEQRSVPHFYLPGGLCYEKLPPHERLMMQAFAAMMKRRAGGKSASPADTALAQMLGASYDLFCPQAVEPLLAALGAESSRGGSARRP